MESLRIAVETKEREKRQWAEESSAEYSELQFAKVKIQSDLEKAQKRGGELEKELERWRPRE